MRMPPSRSVLASAAAALTLLAAGAVHAQTLPTAGNASQPLMKHQAPQVPKEVPPPALPGAKATFQPAERTQLDLSPTDALFDAINRGDIAGARDAVNRGADLGGQNVLGMTPVELSVDLSRNDITFLLLSLRGSIGAVGAPPPATAAATPPAGKTAAGKTIAAKAAAKASVTKVAATRPAPAQPAPQQFAGPANTGTPNPQAGFLGFGGSVQ